jgi:hypothetical protein
MFRGTNIGAVVGSIRTTPEAEIVERQVAQPVSDEIISGWPQRCFAIAQWNDRPGLLARAMVEKTVAVVEVVENGERFFIKPEDRKRSQTVVNMWSERDSLLTLTADQAVQTGIADKIVASREELFDDLEAKQAVKVADRNFSRARRTFERAKRTIDRALDTIDRLNERADNILEQVNAIEDEFRSANNVSYFERYRYWNIEVVLEQMLIDRDVLLNQLLGVWADLIREYSRALPVADKHPDLRHHTETFQKGLESAQAKYREIHFRPIY